MNPRDPLAKQAAVELRKLSSQRHRFGIWVVTPNPRNSVLLKRVAGELGMRYVDVLAELMPQLTDASEKPLGVFGPDDLNAWVQKLSYEPSSPPLLIDATEPLLATFSKPEAISFFRLATNFSARASVVMASYLSTIIEASGFSTSRIWHVPDEGDLWRT